MRNVQSANFHFVCNVPVGVYVEDFVVKTVGIFVSGAVKLAAGNALPIRKKMK